MWFTGNILVLASWLFNISIDALVFKFATIFGNSTGLLAGWSILRDIANILLLFGFVSIGVQTILNINHFSVGKTLPRLVIFAVLLNFSLFASEAIIDATNGVATAIFSQTYGHECDGNLDKNCPLSHGIGSAILQYTGIGSVMDIATAQNTPNDAIFTGDSLSRIVAFLILSILLSVAAFTLFAGAFLLVSRALVLVFLMVTSPIGFAGLAIPMLNQIGERWWKTLINNALFAPAYLTLVFVSIKIMQAFQGISFTNNGTAGANLVTAAQAAINGGDVGGLLIFLMMIGFLIMAVMAAKQFGIAAADTATQMAGNLTYGTIGWAGRRTIGAASNTIARNIRSSRLGNSVVGRSLAGIADIGAKASFDTRNTTVAKMIGKESKVNFGKVSKVAQGGRREELKDIQKRASANAQAVVDARKKADGEKAQDIKDVQRKLELEEATLYNLQKYQSAEQEAVTRSEKAMSDARARGDDASYRKSATERDQHKEALAPIAAQIKQSKERKEALEKEVTKAKNSLTSLQENRLSGDDLILRRYHEAGGAARAKMDDAQNKAAAAAGKVEESLKKAAEHAERIADLESKRTYYGDADGSNARIDEEIKALQALKESADASTAAAKEAQKEANEKLAGLEKKFNEALKEEKKKAEEYVNPKYALQQIARNLDTLGKVVPDFHEAARGVYAEAGQSKEAKLAHEIQHMLEHAGSGHGEATHGTEEHHDEVHEKPPTGHAPAPKKH
jgi:hypothetical protein